MEDRIWFGILGEKFTIRIVKSLFPKKQGYSYKTNDFRKYNKGFGIDVLVYLNGVPYLAIEVKNLHERKHKKPYGHTWAKDEVLNRFLDEKQKFPIKIIFTTYKSNHSKGAISLFKAEGIHVFTTEKFIEKTDLPQRKHNSNFYYSTKSLFEKFINELTKQKKFLGFNGCNSLDNYLAITSNSLITNNKIPYTENKKTKNKPLNVIPEFSYEQYVKDWAKT